MRARLAQAPAARAAWKDRGWLVLAPMAAAVAALVVVARGPLLLPVPSAAVLELTAGRVRVANRAQGWSDATAGITLGEASRVQTDDHSRALIRLRKGAAVLVQPRTDLAVESVGEPTFLRMSGGGMVVLSRSGGLVVQASRYRFEAEASAFAIREQAATEISLRVDQGEVVVVSGSERHRVAAGGLWSSSPSVPAPSDDQAEALLERSLANAGPRGEIRVDSPTALELRADGIEVGPAPLSWSAPIGRHHFTGAKLTRSVEADAVTSHGAPASLTLTLPAAVSAPASPPAVEAPPAPVPASPRPAAVWRAPAATIARQPSLPPHAPAASDAALTPPIPTASPAPPSEALPAAVTSLSPRVAPPPALPEPVAPLPPAVAPPAALPEPQVDPYEHALSVARAGDAAHAAELLEAVVEGQGAHADLALYELGRMRQRKLGDVPGAVEAFTRYRHDYPQGSLDQEVGLSLIEADLGLGQLDQARQEMDRFLRDHPQSERAGQVHLLRGNLLRERGDCQGALDDYRLSSGPAHDQEDILYYTAWCQRKLALMDEAETTLRELLRRFPDGRHRAEAAHALGQ